MKKVIWQKYSMQQKVLMQKQFYIDGCKDIWRKPNGISLLIVTFVRAAPYPDKTLQKTRLLLVDGSRLGKAGTPSVEEW